MRYIRQYKTNIPFSLHDSRIQKIIYQDTNLIFKVDKVFEYKDDKEIMYPADIIFTNVDISDCKILIFDNSIYNNRKKVSASNLTLDIFIKQYNNLEFEIITETNNIYDKIFMGELKKSNNPSAIISIWSMGEMIYELGNAF